MSKELYELFLEGLSEEQKFQLTAATALRKLEERIIDLETPVTKKDDFERQLLAVEATGEQHDVALSTLQEEVQELREQITKVVYDLYAEPPKEEEPPKQAKREPKRHFYTLEEKLRTMWNQQRESKLPLTRRRCVVCGDNIAPGHSFTCGKRACKLVQHATSNMRLIGWTDEKVQKWGEEHPEHLTIVAGEGVRDR